MKKIKGATLDLIISTSNKLNETEDPFSWTKLDERLWMLESLSDQELYVESDLLLNKHIKGIIQAKNGNPDDTEFFRILIKCVSLILNSVELNYELSNEARYVLHHYLAQDSLGLIVSKNY